MIEIWTGNEPLLMRHRSEKEACGIEFAEVNVCLKGGQLTAERVADCFAEPFMAEKRYLVFECSDLKDENLVRLLKAGTPNEVRVIVHSVDKRSAVYKKYQKCIVEFNRLSASDFRRYCERLVGKLMIKIRPHEFDYLLDRIHYGERADCDLITVRIWFEMIACAGVATKGEIDTIVPVYDGDNGFKLFEYLVDGRKGDYYRLLERLLSEKEDAIKLLSLLLYNYRLAFKVALVGSQSAQSVLGISAFQLQKCRMDRDTARKGMRICQNGVNQIKTGYMSGREAIISSSALLVRLKEEKR